MAANFHLRWIEHFGSELHSPHTALLRLLDLSVLILAFLFLASYTSNLTAILTIQRLTPTILDITTAINSNAAIGYQQASFVSSYLQQLGDKLVSLSGESKYASSLASGRVAVIVDENPYLAVFTSKFCDVMQAAQPFSSLNLAFAFQKGSALGPDISNAIAALRMTQGSALCLWGVTNNRPLCSVAFTLLLPTGAFQKGSALGPDISNAIAALRMTQEVEQLHAKYFSVRMIHLLPHPPHLPHGFHQCSSPASFSIHSALS
ncbi:unnamed protein product [Closterium sp. Naga37s-1]|nr:unnamed protein product [Closterium sp. Naga37s-1]